MAEYQNRFRFYDSSNKYVKKYDYKETKLC